MIRNLLTAKSCVGGAAAGEGTDAAEEQEQGATGGARESTQRTQVAEEQEQGATGRARESTLQYVHR